MVLKCYPIPKSKIKTPSDTENSISLILLFELSSVFGLSGLFSLIELVFLIYVFLLCFWLYFDI